MVLRWVFWGNLLSDKRKKGIHRSPTYYTFNEAMYEKALKKRLILG